jgi:hypothetical protein
MGAKNRPGATSLWPRWSRLYPRPSPGQALGRLVGRLAPLYPKGERGRPPIGLERMLRVYFVQQWYGLSDEKGWRTRFTTARRGAVLLV